MPPTAHSSTTASQPTESHPRQALRNRNLPKLPDFEFPKRQPSPDPLRSHPTTLIEALRRETSAVPATRAPSPPRKKAPVVRPLQQTFVPNIKVINELDYSEILDRNENEQKRHLIELEKKEKKDEELQKKAEEQIEEIAILDMSGESQWIFYAIASGGCAAANGVFAKLTTTDLTTSIATSIANAIGLSKGEAAFEVLIRAVFFGLNLIFNGIMWALFTKALSRSPSTTQVSILNTSSNFMLTALLGLIIFSESLPPLWWVGAALLVAGNVIIGKREEKDVAVVDADGDEAEGRRAAGAAESGEGGYRDSREEGKALLADDIELKTDTEEEVKRKRAAKRLEEEDILDLDPPAAGSSVRL